MNSRKCEIAANFGMKAVVISNKEGTPMVKVKIDDCADENLMGPFLSAIKSFSREILGDGSEVSFRTGNLDLYCFTKQYQKLELMIFTLMDNSMVKIDLRSESESALDAFVSHFGEDKILKWTGDVSMYVSFEQALQNQIKEYFNRVNQAKDNNKDATSSKNGFFARILEKLRIK